MKKILINLVHPNLGESVVNKRLLDGIKDIENITINNLYEKYPDFKIDVAIEQKLLLENDIILFQFPLYWFSSPALLREWFDTVFSRGFSHAGIYSLENKIFTLAVSCGCSQKSFRSIDTNKSTVDEILVPFETTANYVKMRYSEPFITYNAEPTLSEETLNKYAKDYSEYIKAFKRG